LIANTYITSRKQSKASVGKSGNEGKMQTVLEWITFSTTKDLVTLQIINTNTVVPNYIAKLYVVEDNYHSCSDQFAL